MSKKLRDVDSADQAQNLHAFGYSLYGGVIFGLLGYFVGGIIGAIAGYVLGSALIYLLTTLFAGGMGAGAATVYMSSGSSTPGKREYSLGDALSMQGKYGEAADEYERSAVVYPEDPEPRLRLARMLRDRVLDYERAAHWFRQALDASEIEPGIEVQAYRELAELYTHRLKQPQRALPVLAKLIDRHPSTPAAQWARAQMAETKQDMLNQRLEE